MNMGKKAFIAVLTCVTAAVCTTAGAQTGNLPESVGLAPYAAPDTGPVVDHRQPAGPLGGGGASHVLGCDTCGFLQATQSTDPINVVPFNSVACHAANVTFQNSYWRGFTIAELGPAPFAICGIEIGIELATSNDGTGTQPITVKLYDTPDPLLADAGNLVHESLHFIGDRDEELECFPVSGEVITGLTVEIFIEDSSADGSGNGHFFFIGSNPAGQSSPSFLSTGPPCNIPVTDLADPGLNFPGMHIIMTVIGGGLDPALECPTDTNNDRVTNVLDLIQVLLCFGQSDDPPCDTGQDTNEDGVTNVLDLIAVLLAFGQECPPLNVLTVVCDAGSETAANELCCDFDWTVTNNGPDPVDIFWLDLENGPTDPIDCRTITLTGWNVFACLLWDGNAASNHTVYEFTGGVLAPGASASGTLNVEVNPTAGGSNVVKVDWIPFFVPEKAIHCHVTSVPGNQSCASGDFSPHFDGNGNQAPDQSWSGQGNWQCFPKDVCAGAENIVLPPAGNAGTFSGANNTTVGATVDLDAPVCLNEIPPHDPVEVVALGNWYRVIGNGTELTASLCNARINYAAALSVYSGPCGSLSCVGNFGAETNNVLCPPFSAPEVTWCSVDGLEYLILVHGANQAVAGEYRLDIITDGTACSVCEAGKIPEGEPDCQDEDEDSFNSGCNATFESFSTIACGDEICGSYGNFIVTDPKTGDANLRDTDWYQIVTTEPTSFTFKVQGECETLFGVINNFGVGDCRLIGPPDFLEAVVVGPSSRAEVTTVCLPAGIWWFFVAPANFTGCACGSNYNASLTCVTCVPTQLDHCEGRVTIPVGVTPFDITGMGTDGQAHGACLPGAIFLVDNDIWYNFNAPGEGTLTVTTCEQLGGSADFDTAIIVYDGCDCVAGIENPPLACNDDDLSNPCGELAGHSTVFVPIAAAGCYKIRVGGFSPEVAGGDPRTGNLNLIFVPGPDPGCPLVCDAGKILENEPDCADEFEDLFNGGCDDTLNIAFVDIDCDDGIGDTEAVCGTYGAFFVTDPDTGNPIPTHDHDWYRVTTTVDTVFHWTVTGECQTVIAIIDSGLPDPECTNLTTLVIDTIAACEEGSVTSPCVPPGTYYFFVSPFQDMACDCGSEYNATLTCVELPGCACDVVPVGGEVLENEANCGIPADTVNGGCNSTPIVFNSLVSCGQTVFGTSALVQGRRDTDWWLITLASPMIISWEVEAEFEFVAFILSGPPADCMNIVTEAAATGFPCQPATATSNGPLPAGQYILFVAPVFTQDDFACGANYTGTVTCTP